jgi:hypothetical protein
VKVIIAGGRDFKDYDLLCRKADYYLSRQSEIEIVSGTARGTDKLGERYADERGYPIKRFPADWGTFGKRAGYLRNEDMAIYADALIAFWNQRSKGTKHMIDIAEQHGLKVRIVIYNNTENESN